MATLNNCQFIGRLGKDPETGTGNTPTTRFSLAVDQPGSEKPLWVNVVCFDDLATRMAKMLYKGAQVFAQGRMQERTYTGRDGQERKATEFNAGSNPANIQLLDKRRDNEEAAQG
jgi:single-strand DNA-binding protein